MPDEVGDTIGTTSFATPEAQHLTMPAPRYDAIDTAADRSAASPRQAITISREPLERWCNSSRG